MSNRVKINGGKLTELIDEKNIPLYAFAALAEVSTVALRRMRRGLVCNKLTAEAVAKALKVELSEIVEGE